MPKNTFNGATMYYTDVSTYYPNNPDFDHFVFQQVLPESGDPDNTYGLCAYAVFISGAPPTLIKLGPQEKDGKTYKAPKGAQFANMRLYPTGLATLYPSLPKWTPDIALTPASAYKDTEYVVYNATTPNEDETTNTVTINPSPPYSG